MDDKTINHAIDINLGDDVWAMFDNARGSAIRDLAAEHKSNAEVTVAEDVDPTDQETSFTNAMMVDTGNGITVSLAVDATTIPGVDDATTHEDVATAIKSFFATTGLRVEAQIGSDDEPEDVAPTRDEIIGRILSDDSRGAVSMTEASGSSDRIVSIEDIHLILEEVVAAEEINAATLAVIDDGSYESEITRADGETLKYTINSDRVDRRNGFFIDITGWTYETSNGDTTTVKVDGQGGDVTPAEFARSIIDTILEWAAK